MSARLRRAALRIARAVLDRLEHTSGLTPSQRVWLLEDLREDLEAMVDDAENRGVTDTAAREMFVVRSLVVWLEGDGAPPGAEAIGYLGRTLKALPRDPSEDELAFGKAYLAAIGELNGGMEAASRLWREPSGDPEEALGLLDVQGRRIRGLVEERGFGIGELAREIGIDTVTLVSIPLRAGGDAGIPDGRACRRLSASPPTTSSPTAGPRPTTSGAGPGDPP